MESVAMDRLYDANILMHPHGLANTWDSSRGPNTSSPAISGAASQISNSSMSCEAQAGHSLHSNSNLKQNASPHDNSERFLSPFASCSMTSNEQAMNTSANWSAPSGAQRISIAGASNSTPSAPLRMHSGSSAAHIDQLQMLSAQLEAALSTSLQAKQELQSQLSAALPPYLASRAASMAPPRGSLHQPSFRSAFNPRVQSFCAAGVRGRGSTGSLKGMKGGGNGFLSLSRCATDAQRVLHSTPAGRVKSTDAADEHERGGAAAAAVAGAAAGDGRDSALLGRSMTETRARSGLPPRMRGNSMIRAARGSFSRAAAALAGAPSFTSAASSSPFRTLLPHSSSSPPRAPAATSSDPRLASGQYPTVASPPRTRLSLRSAHNPSSRQPNISPPSSPFPARNRASSPSSAPNKASSYPWQHDPNSPLTSPTSHLPHAGEGRWAHGARSGSSGGSSSLGCDVAAGPSPRAAEAALRNASSTEARSPVHFQLLDVEASAFSTASFAHEAVRADSKSPRWSASRASPWVLPPNASAAAELPPVLYEDSLWEALPDIALDPPGCRLHQRKAPGLQLRVGSSSLAVGEWTPDGWTPLDITDEVVIPDLPVVPADDVVKVQLLGRGCFGCVWLSKWRGVEVAFKELHSDTSPKDAPAQLEAFSEAERLADLRHPCIISFFGIVLSPDGDGYGTISEYVRGGSLRAALQKLQRLQGGLDLRTKAAISLQAARGMEYLHSQGMVHFDLKLENLLCDLRDLSSPVVKIGDLGLTLTKKQIRLSTCMLGTLPWMAPELFRARTDASGELAEAVTEKVDVFSFGVVLWEIWQMGQAPYADTPHEEIFAGLLTGTLRPDCPEGCDPDWAELMMHCWQAAPSARPSFSQIADKLDEVIMRCTLN